MMFVGAGLATLAIKIVIKQDFADSATADWWWSDDHWWWLIKHVQSRQGCDDNDQLMLNQNNHWMKDNKKIKTSSHGWWPWCRWGRTMMGKISHNCWIFHCRLSKLNDQQQSKLTIIEPSVALTKHHDPSRQHSTLFNLMRGGARRYKSHHRALQIACWAAHHKPRPAHEWLPHSSLAAEQQGQYHSWAPHFS